MDKLKNIRIYISGAIDRVHDDGIGWRDKMKNLCKEKSLPVQFLDPCNKPEHLGQEIGSEKKRVEMLKSNGENTWKKLQQEVKLFKRIDYRMVDMCDLYICYIDINVHMCGSYFECKVAEEERKPMLFILAAGMQKKDIPSWLVDIADWEKIFLSVEECVGYLEKLNNGSVEMSDKWIKVF